MTDTNDEYGLCPLGVEGLQLKHRIAQDKLHAKNDLFDPGFATLETDDEAAIPSNMEGMLEARRNSRPI